MKKMLDSVPIALSILIPTLGGYGYVLAVSFRTDANAKAIQEVQAKQNDMEQLKTDIAVIKEQVLEIRKRVGE